MGTNGLQSLFILLIVIGLRGISSSPQAGTFDYQLLRKDWKYLTGQWEAKGEYVREEGNIFDAITEDPEAQKEETPTDCFIEINLLRKGSTIPDTITPCKTDELGWKYYEIRGDEQRSSIPQSVKLRTDPSTGKLLQWLPGDNGGKSEAGEGGTKQNH
jgi:hypothetical protein